jgi:hypothetical protein
MLHLPSGLFWGNGFKPKTNSRFSGLINPGKGLIQLLGIFGIGKASIIRPY